MKVTEAIKGQDELKLAVEKLESEIFKDWPVNPIMRDEIGVLMDSSIPFTVINCTVINSTEGVMVSDLLDDWNKLDNEHKNFVLRVRNGGVCKRAAEPHSIDSKERCDPPNNEYFKKIYLWGKAEESGFIECTGSYKWLVTEKFSDLEKLVFIIN